MHPAPLPGRVLAWTVLAFLVLPATARAQGEILPQGFELQPVITDVFEPGRPVGFAELPDGRFLVIERNTGFVRLHAVGSAVAPVIHTVPDVSIEAERGLLGIAIDPGWPARPYVYVYYTYFTKATGNLGRLRLYTATGDLADPLSSTLALGNPFDLLTDLPDDSEIHNGGTLRFGPDGMLYLSLGDDGDACNAQDLTTLAGGILRLDVSGMPEVGPGPPDKADLVAAGNPFNPLVPFRVETQTGRGVHDQPGPDPRQIVEVTAGIQQQSCGPGLSIARRFRIDDQESGVTVRVGRGCEVRPV